MRKFSLLLMVFSAVALAQQATPPPVQATNVVEKELAPNYSDRYCAGFLSKEPISRANFVAAGSETPNAALYGDGGLLFLKGADYQPDQLFTIVRPVTDLNHYEPFAGQHSLLEQAGEPYAEIARVRVLKLTPGDHTAVARVEFACQPVTPGDLVIPFQEKAPLLFRKEKTQFDQFPGPAALIGRIVLAKDFDTFVGNGAKVYINAGANKGLKPGDYLRVTRGYAREDLDAAAALNYDAGIGVELQKNAPKMTNEDRKKLPRHALGEVFVLSVTPTSATAMITLAIDAIRVGDSVELEGPQQ